MSDFQDYIFVVVGVLAAVVQPLLLALLRQEFPLLSKGGMPPWLKKYGVLFLFCAVTGGIVFAIYKNTATDPKAVMPWFQAFVLGYGWEAFIEKWQKKA